MRGLEKFLASHTVFTELSKALLMLFALLGVTLTAVAEEEVMRLDQGYFYWNRYLTPDNAGEVDQQELVNLGLWEKISPEAREAGSIGFGSYKIPLPQLKPGVYELSFAHIASAADIWIVPLDSPAHSLNHKIGRVWTPHTPEIPILAKPVLSFQVKDSAESWVLIVNSSNHARLRAGIWHPPQLAAYPLLSVKQRQRAILSFFCSGAMFIMLLYQVMIFFRRTNDRSALALAAICFCIIMRSAGVDSYLYEWIRNPTDKWVHELTIKLEYIPIVAAPMSAFWFLVTTYRKVKPLHGTFPLALALSMILVIFAVFASARQLESYLLCFQICSMSIAALCLIQIIRAIYNAERGSLFTLVGILIPILLGMFEGYLYLSGKGFNFTTYAAVFFVFMQSQVLADRFAAAYRKSEHLGKELAREVEKQTSQIKHIMRHVPEGIGVLGRSLHLNAVYSDFMGRLFKSESLVSERFDKLVCKEFKLDESSRVMFPSTLESLIGDSHLAWEMNSHLLVAEARTLDNRHLAFDWNPILLQDTVDEVLVIVRDVTEINRLRLQSKARDAEFEYFLAFSRMNRLTVLQLQANILRLQKELVQLSKNPSDTEYWTRQVLICLHTLKGNFRQSEMNSLANLTHEAEQSIVDLKAHPRRMELSVEKLDGFAQELEQSLASIQLVIQRLYSGLAAAVPDQALTVVLKEQFQSLWVQHRKSGYHEPELTLVGPIDSIPSPLREALMDVWSHLVTNSFDHGLQASDRSEVFRIQFSARTDQAALILEYSDSGPGLPIEKILKKARRLQIVPDSFISSPENIASLIFVPGFSTRDEVSQSSGRGIGMDAVKTRLEMAGAQVELKLLSSGKDPSLFPFILLVRCMGGKTSL